MAETVEHVVGQAVKNNHLNVHGSLLTERKQTANLPSRSARGHPFSVSHWKAQLGLSIKKCFQSRWTATNGA
jgi:hypothetical protein